MSEALFDMTQGASAYKENGAENSAWVLKWYCDERPDIQTVIARLSLQSTLLDIPVNIGKEDLVIRKETEENWLEKVYEELSPLSVGPFFIYGSHYDGAVPDGQIGIIMDAATAFGSGDHGTTKGCLRAMLDLKGQGVCPWNVLDMGTGSGILAIAAYKLWHTPVTAVDIDREAVRMATRYRDLNSVPGSNKGGMAVEGCDGFDSKTVQRKRPFDLTLANILAGPLIDMAAGLADALDENGYAVLSGMLRTQTEEVSAAYEPLGLMLKDRIDIGKWSTLVWQKV